MANSGELMLVCTWASVNDVVQNKLFYNSSTEPAFTRSKSLTETPDECTRSVAS